MGGFLEASLFFHLFNLLSKVGHVIHIEAICRFRIEKAGDEDDPSIFG